MGVAVGLPAVALQGSGEEELVSRVEGVKMATGSAIGVLLDK